MNAETYIRKVILEPCGMTSSGFINEFGRGDLMLLEFAKTFGLGKNTIFGLGNIDYWKRTTKMEK